MKLAKRLKRREALISLMVMSKAMTQPEAEAFADALYGPLPKPAKAYPSPNNRGGKKAASDRRKKRGKRR